MWKERNKGKYAYYLFDSILRSMIFMISVLHDVRGCRLLPHSGGGWRGSARTAACARAVTAATKMPMPAKM